jgi:broad specificity phosphatase PhoE
MITVLYFVRHGDKDEETKERKLTEKGKIEAQKAGKFLSQFPIEHIVASPSLRTRQTAELINVFFGIPIVEDERLHERAEFGATTYSHEECVSIWRKASYKRTWQPPVGESSRKKGEEIERAVGDLVQKNFAHVVIVTHGGSISDFLRNIAGSRLKRMKRYFGDVSILTGSISIVEYDHDLKKFTLRCVNFTEHLL